MVPLKLYLKYSSNFIPSTFKLHRANPVGIYCLLPNKTAHTYARMIKELKQLLPGAHPRKILVDFEQAPINAFRAGYPLADILGCYFHLKQSVNRKINDLGLKEMYESNDDFRLYSRCLSALAYVPEDDVGNSFDTLAEIFGELNGSSELISYFEKTYIRGRRNPRQRNNFAAPLYNVRLWNKHNSTLEGVARTQHRTYQRNMKI
ncbi:uncharacterized protein LOC135922035 [Gordionus sp. m RMFG-2023]|uniref:uncharacterized protein LOC135922035 n=1 Tax=Gordionus sp. m RMFG-2023 TaxID=3053472 RepID=UPI0031FC4DDB